MKKAAALFFVISLIFFDKYFSYQLPSEFVNFTIKDGLSHNYVKSIFQDKQGFLWIGTSSGLNKYDGYKFTVYKFNPSDSTTISNNRITSITNFDDTRVFVSTEFGFNILNKFTGNNRRVYLPANEKGQIAANAVKKILIDSEGTIYIGTYGAGLFIYDYNRNKFHSFINDPDKKGDSSFDYITDLFEDSENRLWVASFGGLSEFDKSNKSFINYKPDKINKFSLSFKVVTKLAEKDRNNLWLGTAQGINIFNKLSETFSNHLNSSAPYLDNNNITGILFSENDKVVYSTAKNGFCIYDFETGLLKYYNDKSEVSPLPENAVSIIFEDRSGIIWFGTLNTGLFKFIQHKNEFVNINLNEGIGGTNNQKETYRIYEDSKNNIWIGTEHGIYKKEKDSIFYILKFEKELKGKSVISILEDRKNNIWVGTENGLYVFSNDDKLIKSYFKDRNNHLKLKSDAISYLYKDSNSEIWVGTYFEGIAKYNYQNDTFHNYPCAFESDTSLLGYNVTSIVEDKQNNLWIGTLHGLSVLNTVNNTFKHFTHNPKSENSLPSNSILSLELDSYDNLWIGTFGGGLAKYNGTQFKIYLEKDGLPSSVIAQVIDYKGNIWISSDNGICEFDVLNNKFKSFGFDDGLYSKEFNSASGIKSSYGNIYFGSMNGAIRFNPDNLFMNTNIPKTVITSIKVLNKEMIGDYYYNNTLRLNHDEKYITIEFTSLDFTNPSKNHYSYKLFGNDWIDLKNRRYIDFADLQPGNYSFSVKGSNNDLIWDDTGVQISIIINPPFWNTWWFFAFIFSTILSIIYMIHKIIVSQKTKHLLELNKIRLEAADDFHDHIGHTLTKISLFAEMLKKHINLNPVKAIEYTDKIRSASTSLYNEAKDFIWSLDPHNDTVYELAVYLKDFGEDFFSRTGIAFNSQEINEELEKYSLIMKTKREVIFIFKEIMNNSLKHSKAANVYFNIYCKNKTLYFSFKDDGKGFDLESIKEGRGIKSIKSRAEKINFNLQFNSKKTSGTEIVISSSIHEIN